VQGRGCLSDVARFLGQAIDGTPFHAAALYLLSHVPGGPPLVQTVHLLGISVVMGSAVLIDLRVLGLALRGQATEDLIRRLAPWTWSALPFLALSGLVFILAQPYRYFDNPIFRLKFALMVPAIATTMAFHLRPRAGGRAAIVLGALSLCLWTGVVMAGRWIAYVDYLTPVE
jgi:hypothetical protein